MSRRGRIPDRAERWLAWSRSVQPDGYAARFDLQGLSEAVARQIQGNGGAKWIVVTPRYLGVGTGIPATTAHRLLSTLTAAKLLVLRERGSGTAPSKWATGQLPRNGAAETVPPFEPLWGKQYGLGYRARAVFQTVGMGCDQARLASQLGISARVCAAELSKLQAEGLIERSGKHWRATGLPLRQAKSWTNAQDRFEEAKRRQTAERADRLGDGWSEDRRLRRLGRRGGA